MKDGTDRFEQYYVRFFREVYCYFLTSIQNEFQAEEMAQEVFVKLWENIGKIQSPEHAERWIWRVTKNVLIDYYRYRAKYPRMDDQEIAEWGIDLRVPEGEMTENRCFNILCLERICIYLRNLNDLDFKIFWCWQHKEGWEDFSRSTGKSVHALQCRASRLTKKLRKKFGGDRA